MPDVTQVELRDGREKRQAAFRRADRFSRVFLPGAQGLLARAMALRDLGRQSAAWRDLERANEVDPTDPDVNFALLTWGPATARSAAAQRLLESDLASEPRAGKAVQQLMASGAPLAYRLQFVNRARVVGWAVWRNDGALTLRLECDGSTRDEKIAPQPEHSLSGFGLAAALDAAASGEISQASLLVDGEVRAQLRNFHAGHSCAPAPPRGPQSGRAAGHVLVIVPVYADLGATKTCLESLALQRASIEIRAVVVDDGAPDGELRAYLESACRTFGFGLLRNARNLGFVGAVNRALMQHHGGDVLFLNADVTLPEGAVERLRRAVHSAPEIGTAIPFSNNGEFTSFPVPFRANPLPSPEQLARLDRIFSQANASQTIALPSGVGFCLYVKRECFEAVGPFSGLYAPGYGEDSEFCLNARRRGYRNVCAADVFVGHAGNRSFGAAKRALVKRNLRILEERFADFRIECAAFLHADPLRPARSRVERELPPRGATRLLAVASPAFLATARARAAAIARSEADKTILLLQPARAAGRTEMLAFGSSSPQSLDFDLRDEQDHAAFAAYLRACRIDRVEIVGAGELTDEAYALSSSLRAPIDVVCADAWPLSPPPPAGQDSCAAGDAEAPCVSCCARYDLTGEAKTGFGRTLAVLQRVLTGDSRILALDPLAAAFAPFAYGRWPNVRVAQAQGACVSRAGQAVAVLAPTPSVAVDALVKRLGREIRRAGSDADVVVFGACLDDEAAMSSAAVFVTGPAEPAEYPEMIETYEIGLLLCPYRKSHFWLFNEHLGDLPKAYFDWSFGVAQRREGDLAMDPRICDATAARRLISWMSLWNVGAGGHGARA